MLFPPFLLVSLLLFIVWLFVFFLSLHTRREQVLMSLIGLIASPAALLLASIDPRATTPFAQTVGIEDILFTFSLFGIAAVIYQASFGKHVHKLRGPVFHLPHPAMHWGVHLALILASWIILALVAEIGLQIPSIQAAIVAGLLIGTYLIADRHDLLLNALLSGFFTAALLFTIEQVFFVRLFPEAAATFWNTNGLSGLLFGGIPLEEIVWAGVVGFAIGPVYEYVRKYKLV